MVKMNSESSTTLNTVYTNAFSTCSQLFRGESSFLSIQQAIMMNLFRKKESKKSEFEIEEDDEEKGERSL